MAIPKALILVQLVFGVFAAAWGVWASADTAQAGVLQQSAGPFARTVWDGVYTAEQAARGKAGYTTYCSECHEDSLEGGRGRPLVGATFWRDWGEDSLDGLFNIMRTAMPRDNPASLTDNQYLDIVAYILQVNGLPAGTAELTPGLTSKIQVVGKDGPGPMPSFALVQVVGCLAAGKDNTWMLVNAGNPFRVRNPKPLSDVADLQNLPLGTGTFRILSPNAAQLSPDAGHKVLIKGFLVRAPNDDRLNFTSVTVLTPACAP